MSSVIELPGKISVCSRRKCPISHEQCYGRHCAFASTMMDPKAARVPVMDLTHDDHSAEGIITTLGVWRCMPNPAKPIVDKDVVRWIRTRPGLEDYKERR